jgi:hypothetical protein
MSRLPRHPDTIAIGMLVLVIGVAIGFVSWFDDWLTEFDIFTFFLPTFGLIGDRLRAGEIPAWNPSDLIGYSLAGSPGAGWMFLPTMFTFPFFETITAYKVFVAIEMLTAGLATYGFARRIGLMPLAAWASAIALVTGPILYAATSYVTIIGQVTPFLALGFLGIESALQSRRIASFLGWCGVVAISMSQIAIAWPQGMLYAGIFFGGWVVWRWFFDPRTGFEFSLQVVRKSLVLGAVSLPLAFAFGAAAILPTLSFIDQSNIAGGDYSVVVGGDYAAYTNPMVPMLGTMLGFEFIWRPVELSATVIMLGLTGLLLCARRYGSALFAILIFLMLDLAAIHSVTRDHWYLIPQFERLHSHRPTSTGSMTFFPAAMLAGIGVQGLVQLPAKRRRDALLVLPLAAFLALMAWVEQEGGEVFMWQIALAIVATAAILVVANTPLPRRSLAAIGLCVLVVSSPLGVDWYHALAKTDGRGTLLTREESRQEDLATMMDRDPAEGAGRFLIDRANLSQPFRYGPYTGLVTPDSYLPAATTRLDTGTLAVLANGSAMRTGLQQTGGYTIPHYSWLADYVEVMNGAAQDYHYLDLMTPAVSGSPLLDMLNVRYVLVPQILRPQPAIAEFGTAAYQDNRVIVYENPNAFARAWIVHDVQPAQGGAELALFNTGQVDGHLTAFVDGNLPPVSSPAAGDPGDSVLVTNYEPESITMTARSTGDGLLVVSEVYADGWNAYVDGSKVDILRTNHALRGVPLGAGEHVVEMKYEPRELTIGLWSTGFSSIAILGVWIWAGIDRRRRRTPCHSVPPPSFRRRRNLFSRHHAYSVAPSVS